MCGVIYSVYLDLISAHDLIYMLALGSPAEANIGKYLTAKTVLVKHFSWCFACAWKYANIAASMR
jgi:hypothetical protein